MHGIAQGFIQGISGGNAGQSFLTAAISSIAAGGYGMLGGVTQTGVGQVLFGTVAGGVTAQLQGGNFWEGAAIGLTVSLLNHTAHMMDGPGDPPTKEEIEQEYWRKYNEERSMPLNKGLIEFVFVADGAAGLSELFAYELPSLASVKGWFTFGAKNIIPEGKLGNHLFSSVSGRVKLLDTAGNRALITKISNGRSLGVDAYGKSWYAKNLSNGQQIYSYSQNGIIKGAGINSKYVDLVARYGLK